MLKTPVEAPLVSHEEDVPSRLEQGFLHHVVQFNRIILIAEAKTDEGVCRPAFPCRETRLLMGVRIDATHFG